MDKALPLKPAFLRQSVMGYMRRGGPARRSLLQRKSGVIPISGEYMPPQNKFSLSSSFRELFKIPQEAFQGASFSGGNLFCQNRKQGSTFTQGVPCTEKISPASSPIQGAKRRQFFGGFLRLGGQTPHPSPRGSLMYLPTQLGVPLMNLPPSLTRIFEIRCG